MEPGFVSGYWVVMYNSLECELNREFARDLREAKFKLMKMIDDGVLEDGDSYKIVSGESEQD